MLKDQKKKALEEKEKKRLERKQKKGKDNTEENTQPEEQKTEEIPEPTTEISQTDSTPQPNGIAESEKKIEESPLAQEKRRLKTLLENETEPVVKFGLNAIGDTALTQFLNEFLALRLIQSDGTFRPIVKKILTGIFNQLNESPDSISESFKTSIHDIDVGSLLKIREKEERKAKINDFINSLEKKTQSEPLKVWKFLELFGYDLWLNQAGFNQVHENHKNHKLLPHKGLEQLMEFVQVDLCKENKSVLNYPPYNIRPLYDANILEFDEETPINYVEEAVLPARYKYLTNFKLYEIRFAWSLIKVFNKNLSEAIDFFNPTTASTFSMNAKWFNIGTYLAALRNYWLNPIKIELSNKVMQKTAIARDNVPKVQIERLKMTKEKEKEKEKEKNKSPNEIVSYKNRDEFIFTKAYEQLKEVSTTLFRPIKPTGSDPFLAFEVVFKGELVMGEAGPYRQFFADISQELQPNSVSVTSLHKNLNLLCPSPNNYSKLGEGRDKFVINPSASTSYQLQLFEFLGILMGCSVRTGAHLTLDLPTLFWKQLTNQNITIEDLEEVDKPLTDLIQFMGECSKDAFEDSIFENYSTMLSDKSIYELRPGGSKIRVRFEDRFDYMARVLEVRVNESKLQIDAIRRGLTKLVPQPFMNTITAKDLEIWVCGRSRVDVDLLKRHTKYSAGLSEESDRVKFLWETLKELSETEKLRFVKFCWGQERLPANDEEFERTQTRFMIKPSTGPNANSNLALPKADTCFFNLELPNYTTKASLKDRLLLAINTDCDSINADPEINLDPNAHHRGRDRDDFDNIVPEEGDEE